MSISEKMLFTREVMSSLSGLDEDAALKISAAIMEKLSEYEIDKVSTESVDFDYLGAFIEAKTTEGRSQKTIGQYEYVVKRFLTAVNIPTEKVTVFTLRSYLAGLQKQGLSDKTRRNYRNCLSSYFTWLAAEKLIEDNPCGNLGSVKIRKEIKTPYDSTEVERIRECCGDIRDRAIVDVLLSSGCRISELCGMNISDVDFNRLQARVLGKGNKERTVYLSEVAVMNLQRYLSKRTDKSRALFAGRGTERMTPSGVRKMLKEIADKAGVENVHPHRFRRTMATTLINRGMPIQEVSSLLGHDSINTTLTYVYMDSRYTKIAYEKHAI